MSGLRNGAHAPHSPCRLSATVDSPYAGVLSMGVPDLQTAEADPESGTAREANGHGLILVSKPVPGENCAISCLSIIA